MTRKLEVFIPITCIMFILAGCYEKVDWDSPHFESKPVMNSILVNGKPVRVHVSLAVPYGAKESIVVKDAEVNLFVDGTFTETLVYQEKGYYKSQLVGRRIPVFSGLYVIGYMMNKHRLMTVNGKMLPALL